ncbi:hypothetical protein IZ6_27170 [Terrihabitans soli]|uniref:Bacteriophage T5 Orf172 DNA-binding domain-containing protein n=1 Tax=Terrihabitans soli TaxID=708113 RepID=A0A6S6QXI1_9HYPH|nr:GIY-YIG nuclease family protein [Terrihabitans soli]BCJ91982.1 hypothetical protein IZ6_27170 [Terrihabitans soli]
MLTSKENAFLRSQRLTPNDVYDGRGESQLERGEHAKAAGKSIVLAAACMRGHRLRTLHGHCVQCDISKLADQKRFSTAGLVYIAGSLSKELIRIGFSTDPDQRDSKLLFQSYGGAADWALLYSANVDDAGRIEDMARRRLKAFRATAEEIGEGAEEATDLLKTTFTRAHRALADAIGAGRCDKVFRARNRAKYDFAK